VEDRIDAAHRTSDIRDIADIALTNVHPGDQPPENPTDRRGDTAKQPTRRTTPIEEADVVSSQQQIPNR